MPMLIKPGFRAPIELLEAWTGDDRGTRRSAFLPGASMQHTALIVNHTSITRTVELAWTQVGPCGKRELFAGRIKAGPGEGEYPIDANSPDCTGIFTSTLDASYGVYTATLSLNLVVNNPSLVIVEGGGVDGNSQGFDKCTVPSVAQMQAWWDSSPYSVFNLYLGGVSFGCTDPRLNPLWLNAVAAQGWTFIPTWVGPQAPCSRYSHRMSYNLAEAYQQGRIEADAAQQAAGQLGLMGDLVIYYDLESYSGASQSCRDAALAFLRGWAERLRQRGYKAGAYGAPCTSYILDWAQIVPPLDSVWIAHWYRQSYDPQAQVWDAPCLDIDPHRNSLWASHQRLKQYAGDHIESWGGLGLRIDSDVLDGLAVWLPTEALTQSIPAPAAGLPAPDGGLNAQSSPRAMGLLSPGQGWVLLAERLLRTEDGGARWQDITPARGAGIRLLAGAFLDAIHGWVLVEAVPGERSQAGLPEGMVAELAVYRTQDGGQSWETVLLPTNPSASDPLVGLPVAGYLDFLDPHTGWVALRLPSGSSFSLGRLFATQDGGLTWEERSLPLGGPAEFMDALRGWSAGGPSGDQLFQTPDGGRSWQPVSLPFPRPPAPGQALVGRPRFTPNGQVLVPVTLAEPDPRFLLFSSADGGLTWRLASSLELAPHATPGASLTFDLTPAGGWRLAVPASSAFGLEGRGGSVLWRSPGPGEARAGGGLQPVMVGSGPSLPGGVLALDFVDDMSAWALYQEGVCRGAKPQPGKTLPPGAVALRCEARAGLLGTLDGGLSWQAIALPGQ